MEFLTVWHALSSSQRSYLSIFLLGAAVLPVLGISMIGQPNDNGTSLELVLAGAGSAVFAFMLYLGVRGKALQAAGQGRELVNDNFSVIGYNKVSGTSGSLRSFVITTGVVGAVSTVMLLGTQGVLAGVAALIVFGSLYKYLDSCAKRLAASEQNMEL